MVFFAFGINIVHAQSYTRREARNRAGSLQGWPLRGEAERYFAVNNSLSWQLRRAAPSPLLYAVYLFLHRPIPNGKLARPDASCVIRQLSLQERRRGVYLSQLRPLSCYGDLGLCNSDSPGPKSLKSSTTYRYAEMALGRRETVRRGT